jgi:Tol biopolymer transport system component
VCDFERGTVTRLTFDALGEDPFWSPDGRRILYNSSRDGAYGLFWKNADGTGAEERLTTNQERPAFSHFTPDGKTLIFGEAGDIWTMPMSGDRKPQPLWRSPALEFAPALSPDGRFLAYESSESGRSEVYVRSFPDLQGRWLLSSGGGNRPVWARSGRELFYREGTRLFVVPISTEKAFQHGQPALLFEASYRETGHYYDVSPDGKRFLFIKPLQAQSQSDQIYVVLNWAEELRGRLRGGK